MRAHTLRAVGAAHLYNIAGDRSLDDDERSGGFRIESGNRQDAMSAKGAKEEAESGRREPGAKLDRLAHEVIGAAIEVHRLLGPGLLESVYEEALCVELGLRGLSFVRQPAVDVAYKGHPVGQGRLDLLVGDALVVELKAVEALTEAHKAQVISYLRMTGYRLALLMNFNVARLKDGINRIVCT